MKKRCAALCLLVLLMLPLSCPAETLDSFFTCRFSYSPAVYSGPSTTYFRAASGKAQYGSPGKARVYGEENGWLLIGYQTGSGQYRLGYIDGARAKDRLYEASYGAVFKALAFDYREVWLARNCELTDDPIISASPMDSLRAGDPCWFLATLENKWAYVEVRRGASWKRGFVPLDALAGLDISPDPAPVQPPALEPVQLPTAAPIATPQPTAEPWNYVDPAVGFSGVWGIANQRLATRSGPSVHDEETGIYYLQNKPVLVLARHYDPATGGWWVKCRIEREDGTVANLWTAVQRFYNQEWLLSELPDE